MAQPLFKGSMAQPVFFSQKWIDKKALLHHLKLNYLVQTNVSNKRDFL